MTTAKSSKIIGMLGSLFVVLSLGLSISVAGQYNSKDQEKSRDGDFIAYACDVVYDTKSGLEWVAGPDKNTNWNVAKQWVGNLTVAGGGWRMPSKKELETLYEEGRGSFNMTPLLKITRFYVWSGESKDSKYAYYFNFKYGFNGTSLHSGSYNPRAVAVRSRK